MIKTHNPSKYFFAEYKAWFSHKVFKSKNGKIYLDENEVIWQDFQTVSLIFAMPGELFFRFKIIYYNSQPSLSH